MSRVTNTQVKENMLMVKTRHTCFAVHSACIEHMLTWCLPICSFVMNPLCPIPIFVCKYFWQKIFIASFPPFITGLYFFSFFHNVMPLPSQHYNYCCVSACNFCFCFFFSKLLVKRAKKAFCSLRMEVAPSTTALTELSSLVLLPTNLLRLV